MLYFTVTGEANFAMEKTCLTVGGFNQPAVARALIEMPGNAEKGLSQRFLWLFPKPEYGKFDTLEPTDEKFTDQIGKYLSTLLCMREAVCPFWNITILLPMLIVNSKA